MKRRASVCIGLAFTAMLVAGVETARATQVRFFLQQTRKDLLDGELDGLAIDADGVLRRAPHFDRFAQIDEPFVFTAATAGDGWVLGTGNSGQVLRVAVDGSVTSLWTAPEPEIFALWTDPDGTVFVGSSPDGKVYSIRGEEVAEVFDPEDSYIWAIARAPWGDLLVGTGDSARLYSVSDSGDHRILFESDEIHIRSLLPLSDAVLLGTVGAGLVQRVDASGTVRTLFDAEQSEVSAFTRDGEGGWYAAAVALEASFTQQARESRESESSEGADEGSDASVSVEITTPAEQSGDARSAILHGTTSGVRRVASLARETVYSLGWVDGRLWIGTGVEGKLYSLVDGGLALEAALDDRQLVGIFQGRGPVLATTNAAAMHRTGSDGDATGRYVSRVLDAGSLARFGSLRWRGTSAAEEAVRFALRSGLSAEPDATWNDWTDPMTGREIDLESLAPGRYVQWRLDLGAAAGSEANVSSVSVSYRQNNGEPRISAFKAMDPGQVLVPSTFNPGDQVYEPAHPNRQGIFTRLEPSSSGNGSRFKTLWRRGFLTLRWEAEDPNEDTLAYALSFRREGGGDTWLPIDADLDEAHYGFDSTVLPDGVYRFRLEASDRPGNGIETALTAERLSEPIVVDNSPPALDSVSGSQVVVADALSPIRSVEVSVDAGEWEPVQPVDGLTDGQREVFAVESPQGAGLVLLRVMDSAFNTVTYDLLEEQR